MPTVIDSTSAQVTTTPSASAPAPTLADGCTVLWMATSRGGTTVTTPPDGFEAVPEASGQSTTTGSGARIHTYRRHVETAASEPSDYAAVMSTSLNGSVMVVSIADADPADPIHVAATLADTTGDDANVACPSATTTADDILVLRVALMTTNDGVASWASADCTEIEDVPSTASPNRCSAALGWEDQATAGATGTATWTATMVGGSVNYGSAFGVTIGIGAATVTADPGGAQTVEPGDTVDLDSSASTGDILSRTWTEDPGNAVPVILADATSVVAKFVAPKPPTDEPMVLTFHLEVVGADNTDTAPTTVTVDPAAEPSLGVFILDDNGDPT